MDIGEAIREMKAGKRVARAGWNGKGMWLAYSPGMPACPAERFWSPANKRYAEEMGGAVTVLPAITMRLASQTDLLADDWSVVE